MFNLMTLLMDTLLMTGAPCKCAVSRIEGHQAQRTSQKWIIIFISIISLRMSPLISTQGGVLPPELGLPSQ